MRRRCLVRLAILDACDGNTITFANTVISPITLVSELAIDKKVTIQGPGANLLAISGNNTVRVFNVGTVTPAINVTLSGLMISNGEATDSSAGGSKGGGIFNNSAGTVSVTNTIIFGNFALSASNAEGGGISNNSTGLVKHHDLRQ